MIDCHCHIHFPQFDSDRKEILEKLVNENIHVINSTVDPCEIEDGLKLSKEKNIYWCIGLSASCLEVGKVDETINLIKKYREDIIGIGEVGLDYYWVKKK